MSPNALTVLTNLRDSAEGESFKSDSGSEWRFVYLDNARPKDMTDKSFRSYLGALSRIDMYQPEDGFAWGRVRIN